MNILSDIALAWKIACNWALIWHIKNDAVALLGTEQAKQFETDVGTLVAKFQPAPEKKSVIVPPSTPAPALPPTPPLPEGWTQQQVYADQEELLKKYSPWDLEK